MSGGFGVSLKITISTTLTAVANVLDIAFPKQIREVADNTSHSATSGYRTYISTGIKALEKFTAKLEWDTDSATHAALVTALGSDTALAMSITSVDTDEAIAFSGFVVGIGRVSPLSGVYTADVEIQPTGAPTIT